jgi:hypothetical protein
MTFISLVSWVDVLYVQNVEDCQGKCQQVVVVVPAVIDLEGTDDLQLAQALDRGEGILYLGQAVDQGEGIQ